MYIFSAWLLIIVNSLHLPLPKPGSDEYAEPPMHIGIEIIDFISKDKCMKAKKWFYDNIHRDGYCLEK